jgi:hypothetical protein
VIRVNVTVPPFEWRGCGKPRQHWVRIDGFLAGSSIGHLPNASGKVRVNLVVLREGKCKNDRENCLNCSFIMGTVQ